MLPQGNCVVFSLINNDCMYNTVWYNSLTKPFLAPPNLIFAPVWAFIYVTIFAALILYTKEPVKNKYKGYLFFAIQILLNIIWPPVFFVLKNILLAFIIVILLDLFVILTIKEFYKVSRISGVILFPYLFWILFATYLNLGYLILN